MTKTTTLEQKQWWKDAPKSFWKSLAAYCLTFFLILFAYPFTRVTAESIYIDAFGGKATPKVWLISVIVLSIVMFFYNMVYKKIGIKMTFIYTSFFSAFFFVIAGYFVSQDEMIWLAFPIFVLKEIYIILLIHLAIGYFNENNTNSSAKMLLGFIGAVGSVGGILGGLTIKYLIAHHDIKTEEILMLSAIPIILGCIAFYLVKFSDEI